MKKNLKANIWIKGFNSGSEMLNLVSDKNFIYAGKTSEISEQEAKECVDRFSALNPILFVNYKNAFYIESQFKTAKESIESACDNKYCVIYLD